MLTEFRAKKAHFQKQYNQLKASDSLTFYRFFVFVRSRKGQKQILNFLWKVIRYIFRKLTGYKPKFDNDYAWWFDKNYPKKKSLAGMKANLLQLSFQPKISIILPVFNPDPTHLKQAIQSVSNQIYDNWELCISDDASTNPEIKQIIEEAIRTDSKIKAVFRKENGHISACSNDALKLATGQYLGFLDHDDCLSPDALYQNIVALNENQDIDLLYSDEDKIDDQLVHSQPYFKADWCPDSFLARNYLNHFVVIKKHWVDKVGGFRIGFEGAQDFDLLLRVTEQVSTIFHINKILYHWRMHQASTSINLEAKPYAFHAGIKAVEEALTRRNLKGSVTLIENLPGFYHIDYDLTEFEKVSIIIPTKNKQDLCEVIIRSIFEQTDYPNFEVILIDNNSDDPEFFSWLKVWQTKEPLRFKCHSDSGGFNFSRLMNRGAEIATGKYLLLLNNDTEVLHSDWITNMVKTAQFKRIGVVGAKLFYPNNTIQHAGVIVGLGGIAGHAFVGAERNDLGYYAYLKCVNNFSALTVACIMVRKEAFDQVGGFEENLAVEFNDIDFCLKLKDKGFDNVFLPQVMLYHYESISRGHPHRDKKAYQQHLNDVNFFKSKWQKYIDHDPCYNNHLSKIFSDFRLNIKD